MLAVENVVAVLFVLFVVVVAEVVVVGRWCSYAKNRLLGLGWWAAACERSGRREGKIESNSAMAMQQGVMQAGACPRRAGWERRTRNTKGAGKRNGGRGERQQGQEEQEAMAELSSGWSAHRRRVLRRVGATDAGSYPSLHYAPNKGRYPLLYCQIRQLAEAGLCTHAHNAAGAYSSVDRPPQLGRSLYDLTLAGRS